jgi:hypothetical protein
MGRVWDSTQTKGAGGRGFAPSRGTIVGGVFVQSLAIS